MCGIVGAFGREGNVSSPNVIEKMRDQMTHRGPDGSGLWADPGKRCILGHRRLSIIDLAPSASQPMVNAAGTVAIVFNGEIYNHEALRAELKALSPYKWTTDHSDTEVLLHAFEEWGLDCVDRLFGMFAFAVFDGRAPDRPKLHLVRDRIGVKPLYLTRTTNNEWLFASEIRALLAHPAVTPEMDLTAFWHYLTFIVAPAPLTMFRGIFKLPAGHRITIDHEGHARAEQWWDCRPSAAKTLRRTDISEDQAKEELLTRLRTAIARRMVSDVDFGVLLSGGVDSSVNVALMTELMDRPVKTFTIGYESYGEFNEFDQARRVAQRYKTEHHERVITSREAIDFLPLMARLQDEPIADNVCIPLYFLSELVKQNGTTVIQVGEGADENLLGYWWCEHYRQKYQSVYRPAMGRKKAGLLGRLLGRSAGLMGEDREIAERARLGQELFWGGAVCWWGGMRKDLTPDPSLFSQALTCPVENLLPPRFHSLDSHDVVAHYMEALSELADPEILQKITYLELKLRLPEQLLMRVDKMTMANSIEARVPFLDHEVVEFAARLPLEYKLNNGIGKWLLKRAAEPLVDHDLLYRRKQGFGAPMDRWFSEEDFSNRVRSLWNRSGLRATGMIDDRYFTGMLDKLRRGGGGYGFHAWTVLNAVLWHEVWIEGRDGSF